MAPSSAEKLQPFSAISQCTTETPITFSKPLSLRKISVPMCPGTGERNIEMVSPGLRLETTVSGRARTTIGGDPVTQRRIGALERPTARLLVGLLIRPDAID